MAVVFKRVVDANRPMLADWLTRPHVTAAGWDRTLLDDLDSFGAAVAPYIAYEDDEPVGYIQSYIAAAAGNGWWPDERDPGVRGIDLFLADESRLGKGLGTRIVQAFAEFLFSDPGVTRIQIDPAPTNARAIRVYEKAGFQAVGPVMTPDGEALLMTRTRKRSG